MRSLGLGLGLGRGCLTIIGGGAGGGEGGPASVLLITDSTTHAAATNTRDAIEAGGHTVTLQSTSGVTASFDFSPYDVIVCTRIAGGSSAMPHVRTAMDGGMPVFVGITSSGAVTSTPGISDNLDLTGPVRVYDNLTGADEENIVDASHEITDSFSAGQTAFYTGLNFGSSVNPPDGYVGDLLATADEDISTISGEPTLIAIEAGTLNMEGVALAARAVVWLNLYGGQNDYNANGEALVDACIDWLIS